MAWGVAAAFAIDVPRDILYVCLPLYHTSGGNTNTTTTTTTTTTVYDAEMLINVIQNFHRSEAACL